MNDNNSNNSASGKLRLNQVISIPEDGQAQLKYWFGVVAQKPRKNGPPKRRKGQWLHYRDGLFPNAFETGLAGKSLLTKKRESSPPGVSMPPQKREISAPTLVQTRERS